MVLLLLGLTLTDAVDLALKNYPAMRAASENVAAAQAGVRLARTDYLPRADFLWQTHRATRNNVFGLLLPQPVISPISGPVLGTNEIRSVWGSATGVLVSWEPFDFGARRAQVDAAQSARQRTEALAALTRLEIATGAADAFLRLLAAEQAQRSAQAAVERARVLHEVVGALVRAELRPGADLARARAELAAAQTQLIQAEQATASARVTLGQWTGQPAQQLAATPGPLLQPPAAEPPAPEIRQHPAAQELLAAVEEARAREKAIERSYFPKFSVLANAYGRGADAAGPNTGNWALGFNITFAALSRPQLRARQEIEEHRQAAETARLDRVLVELNGQLDRARLAFDAARRVAANTPVQIEAAKAAEQQARARYQAGLGSVTEVAEAQKLLAQSEVEDAVARLGVWRALLAVAAAGGDIAPFLAQVKQP
jgi:outer membrane protein TolC